MGSISWENSLLIRVVDALADRCKCCLGGFSNHNGVEIAFGVGKACP